MAVEDDPGAPTTLCAPPAGLGWGRDSGRAIFAYAAAAAARRHQSLMLWASLPARSGTEGSQPGGWGRPGALLRRGGLRSYASQQPWPLALSPAVHCIASHSTWVPSLRPTTSGPGQGWGVAPASRHGAPREGAEQVRASRRERGPLRAPTGRPPRGAPQKWCGASCVPRVAVSQHASPCFLRGSYC